MLVMEGFALTLIKLNMGFTRVQYLDRYYLYYTQNLNVYMDGQKLERVKTIS